jgi:thiol:disulfide interchange protein DsbD
MFGSPRLWTVVVGALIALGAPALAAATGPVSTPHVRAELVASVDRVRPGDRIVVGVHQRIIPGWHTYWKNPGDSGQATTIAWELPPGATAGDILWPMPSRFRLGPVVNYGYSDEVTLLTEVTVPDTVSAGGTFPIRATVDWLVCEEICVPEQVTLGLDLPVAAAGATTGPGSPLIEAARARLPVATPWPARAERRADRLALTVEAGIKDSGRIEDLYFYPADWGVIDHAAEQRLDVRHGNLVLALAGGDDPKPDRDRLAGVLVMTERTADGAVSRAFSIDASIGGSAAGAAAMPAIGLGAALLFALLGGLILNLLPCVFPVLSVKALSLVAHARAGPGRVRRHGAAYAAGVLASFAALAGLLAALKAGGAELGWGFQFQSPVFVLLLAWLMFAVGLLFSGVFTIGGSIAGVGGALAGRPGYAGSFFTGVLAAVVATPAPRPSWARRSASP